jgi:tRNA(Arg) A34 adenosine deaminase TadA
MEDHQAFIREAIRLSQRGMEMNEGGPFGCVIVRNGQIIASGNNKVTSTNDPTAHAEINAIRNACRELNTYELSDCTLYSSCEPCPMCLGAIYWAGISKVFFACSRKDAARIGFDDDFIYKEIQKDFANRIIPIEQMLREEAIKVFEDWLAKPDRVDY